MLCAGVPHHRYDQTAIQTDRNSDIDVALVDNRISIEGSIHNGKLPESPNGSLHKKRRDCKMNPSAVKFRFELFPTLHNAGAIHLKERCDMCGCPPARHHV